MLQEKLQNRHAKKTKTYYLMAVRFFSGDGGNRTRVRKIRASKIYERSRLNFVTQGASTGSDYPESAAWSFARFSGIACGTPRLSRQGLSLAEIGAGGRGLIYGGRLLC